MKATKIYEGSGGAGRCRVAAGYFLRKNGGVKKYYRKQNHHHHSLIRCYFPGLFPNYKLSVASPSSEMK